MMNPNHLYDIRKDGAGTSEVYDLDSGKTAVLHGIALRALALDVAADSARLLNRSHALSRRS